MIDNHPPDDPNWFRLCKPCEWGIHDACMGGVVFCMCFTEITAEIEERGDGDGE